MSEQGVSVRKVGINLGENSTFRLSYLKMQPNGLSYLNSTLQVLDGSFVVVLPTKAVSHCAPRLRTVAVKVSEVLRKRRELNFAVQVPQRSAVELHTENAVRIKTPHLFERLNTLATITTTHQYTGLQCLLDIDDF